MLKFLRWLLVPLLPVLGLIAGYWLIPEAMPLWKTNFTHEITPLGYAEQERFFVVAEGGNNIFKSVIALNIRTGDVAQRVSLPEEFSNGKRLDYRLVKLFDNAHSVILIPDMPTRGTQHLMIFDWLNNRILDRYQSISNDGWINGPTAKGSTLAVMRCNDIKYSLLLWNTERKEPETVIPCAEGAYHIDVGLSDDGLMAHFILKQKDNDRILLIDVKKQTIVQTITGYFREVHWAADHKSFLAIEYDFIQNCQVLQKYILGEEGYLPGHRTALHFGYTIDPPCLDGPFITLYDRNYSDPRRIRLQSVLGPQLRSLLDRFWPIGQVTKLFDKQTGQLLHQFVNTQKESWFHQPFPNQSGSGLILSAGKTVAYWDIYPFSRYYPLLGLVAGLLLATLLAWKLLRHQPRKDKPLIPTSGAA